MDESTTPMIEWAAAYAARWGELVNWQMDKFGVLDEFYEEYAARSHEDPAAAAEADFAAMVAARAAERGA